MAKLTWINGVGVIALAVLCVAQWADSRRIRTELDGALSDRDAIAGELATARQSVEDQASDIDRFRETINDLRARLEKAEAGAASGEGMDQALDEWKRAVEETARLLQVLVADGRGLSASENPTHRGFTRGSEERIL